MVNEKPYEETPVSKEHVIRIFRNGVEEEELKWHFDEEDRVVEVIGKTNWMFQFDNELPFVLESPLSIPKGKWHRVIKGEGDLVVKIFKIDKKSDI